MGHECGVHFVARLVRRDVELHRRAAQAGDALTAAVVAYHIRLLDLDVEVFCARAGRGERERRCM